jgi:hypothetical protein
MQSPTTEIHQLRKRIIHDLATLPLSPWQKPATRRQRILRRGQQAWQRALARIAH